MIEIYESDDTTLVSDLAITNYEAGQTSDTLTVHLWNAKDAPGSPTLEPVLLALRTEDPTRPDVYLASGLPPQDEQWGRVRIVGYDNTGDPSWSIAATDWRALGASSGLLVASLPADCAVQLEIRFQPPTTAQGGTPWRHRLVALYSEYSQPVPPSLTATARGVLHGVGDPGHSGIVDGLEASASDPADDLVTIAPGRWVHRGRFYGAVTQTVQCTQDDGQAAALQAGESYWLALTLGSGLTATKGDKAAAPDKPPPPAGELPVAWIRVDHDAGGTSVVEDADVEDALVYDRYLLIADAAGLGATIHAGQALAGGTWRFRTRPMPLVFPAATTSWVHQLATGNFEVTQSAEPSLETGLGPLWEVETDGANVIRVVDHRRYVPGSRELRFFGAVAVGQVGWHGVEEALAIERVILRASDNGGGSAGQTLVDVTINGVSIYTSSATDDQRPAVAFDAVELRVEAGPHEVTELQAGDVVEVEVVEEPTGGSPAAIEVTLICRRR